MAFMMSSISYDAQKRAVQKTFQWEAMQARLLVCAWDVELPSDISAATI